MLVAFILANIISASLTSASSCSGCYATAPVDLFVTGDGGSFYQPRGQFTWDLADEAITAVENSDIFIPLDASTVVLSGRTIRSYTVYNVFTAFEIIALYEPRGMCVATTLLGETFGSPLFIRVPSSDGSDVVAEAESLFINQLPKVTYITQSDTLFLSAVPVQVQTTAVISSTTGPSRPSPSSSQLVFSFSQNTLTLTAPVTPLQTSGQNSSDTSTSTSVEAVIPTGNNASMNSTAPGDKSDLSQLEKIGLGVGLGIGSAIILAIMGLIIWKHNLRKKSTLAKSDPLAELPYGKPESMPELSSKDPTAQAELENNCRPQELSVERRPELE